jgi:hypothetical protein
MEGSTKYSLVVRSLLVESDKGIFSDRNFKSKGRYKSPIQLAQICWKCGKDRNYKKYYK